MLEMKELRDLKDLAMHDVQPMLQGLGSRSLSPGTNPSPQSEAIGVPRS